MIFSLNIIQFRIMERKKLLNIMFASQKRSSFANYFQNLHFMSYEHFPLFTMKVLNKRICTKRLDWTYFKKDFQHSASFQSKKNVNFFCQTLKLKQIWYSVSLMSFKPWLCSGKYSQRPLRRWPRLLNNFFPTVC